MAKLNEIPLNDQARVDASVLSEQSKIYAAEKLAPLFEIDVIIKLFGRVIFSWHFPPKN